MITGNVEANTSLKQLKHKDYSAYKRVMELYDKWDVAARSKDFHNAEHFEWEIQKIHRQCKVQET